MLRQCNYTAHAPKHSTELYSDRPRYQTDTSGYNTTRATLEGIHAPGRAPPIPDTTATPGRCTGQHKPLIIIRYIRGCRGAPVMDPCQTVQHIANHASGGGSAPTVCGSLASATPGAPAEGSASPPVQSQPGGSRYFPRPAACSMAPGQRSGRAVWHHPPGGAVQRRAARNHWRLPPHLFSGFRPIANRGQQ